MARPLRIGKRKDLAPFSFSDRNTAIALAYQNGGYSMEKIGIFFGLHYSWVSRVMRDFEKEKNKT